MRFLLNLIRFLMADLWDPLWLINRWFVLSYSLVGERFFKDHLMITDIWSLNSSLFLSGKHLSRWLYNCYLSSLSTRSKRSCPIVFLISCVFRAQKFHFEGRKKNSQLWSFVKILLQDLWHELKTHSLISCGVRKTALALRCVL